MNGPETGRGTEDENQDSCLNLKLTKKNRDKESGSITNGRLT